MPLFSEGVEAAIKFARKTTGRTGLLYCEAAFHGLTCGALSLMGDGFWRDNGALLVLDEVQTGLYRTGTFLAAHQFHLKPDMVVLAMAWSGGLVPVSAVLMTDHIYSSVYDSGSNGRADRPFRRRAWFRGGLVPWWN